MIKIYVEHYVNLPLVFLADEEFSLSKHLLTSYNYNIENYKRLNEISMNFLQEL